MTIALLPSTATKRTIVEMAYEECSLAGYEFNVTPEELFSGLRQLDAVMGELRIQGVPLGYNFPLSFGQGDLDDAAGIPDDVINVIAIKLALRICPKMNKTMSAESRAALSGGMITLRALAAVLPRTYYSYGTVRGAGNNWPGGWRTPYLRTGPPVVTPTPTPTPSLTPQLIFTATANSGYFPVLF